MIYSRFLSNRGFKNLMDDPFSRLNNSLYDFQSPEAYSC
ncbi:hypothetical protein THOD04_90199 [Vibrio owensii]|nr:hypothetical protein THOD04_90199 [Vibrio owensii]